MAANRRATGRVTDDPLVDAVVGAAVVFVVTGALVVVGAAVVFVVTGALVLVVGCGAATFRGKQISSQFYRLYNTARNLRRISIGSCMQIASVLSLNFRWILPYNCI